MSVPRFSTDHINEEGDLIVQAMEETGEDLHKDSCRNRVARGSSPWDAQHFVSHFKHNTIKGGNQDQVDHE